MKVPRKELVNCLETVYPAVGRECFIRQYENFQINKDVVWAYNDKMMIRAQLPCDTGLKCGVPARHFLQLLRSLNEEEVELTFKNRSVHVKAGAINAAFSSLPIYNAKNFSKPMPTYRDTEAISYLIEGLNLCKFAVSKDKDSGIYRGVQFLDDDTLVSSDRFRIVVCTLGKKFPWINCVLPIKLINIMSKVKDEICEIGYSSDNKYFVVLLTDETYIGCKTLEGVDEGGCVGLQ